MIARIHDRTTVTYRNNVIDTLPEYPSPRTGAQRVLGVEPSIGPLTTKGKAGAEVASVTGPCFGIAARVRRSASELPLPCARAACARTPVDKGTTFTRARGGGRHGPPSTENTRGPARFLDVTPG